MDNDNFLLAIAVIAVLVSFVGFSITYNSVSSFQNYLTGFAFENGTINLTVTSVTSINITEVNGSTGSKTLDWGSGRVNNGAGAAHLYTHNSSVSGGSWNAAGPGFRVENIGTRNVSINISLDKTADSFYGKSGGDIQYNLTSWNASLDPANSACETWSGPYNNTYTSFTTTSTKVCDKFLYTSGGIQQDQLRIDIHLQVPEDLPDGSKGTVMYLEYVAV